VLFEEKITEKIIESAIEIHRHLGPGLLESAYEECLCFELKQHDLSFERQKPLPLKYKSIELDCGYRIDILVEDKVIVELKCVDKINPIHEAQLLTYLRLSDKKVGLILNFYVSLMKDGVRRLVL